MANKNMDTRIKELMALGATFTEAHTAALDEWKAMNGKGKAKGTGEPAPEKVEYTKADGTVIMCTPKQAAHFEELKANAPERKAKFEAMCAEWERKYAEYKPSKELIEALKANPIMTRKEAVKLGFVGTKDDLKALKAKHKVYSK